MRCRCTAVENLSTSKRVTSTDTIFRDDISRSLRRVWKETGIQGHCARRFIRDDHSRRDTQILRTLRVVAFRSTFDPSSLGNRKRAPGVPGCPTRTHLLVLYFRPRGDSSPRARDGRRRRRRPLAKLAFSRKSRDGRRRDETFASARVSRERRAVRSRTHTRVLVT